MDKSSTALSNKLLLNNLSILKRYYEDDTVEEIAINSVGKVFIKNIGHNKWNYVEDNEITLENIFSLCRMLSNVTQQVFNEDEMPILATTLPGGHRFQAIVGINVRYDISDTHGMAVCIRRFKVNRTFSLEDFNLKPEQNVVSSFTQQENASSQYRYGDFDYEDLVGAVSNGEAVLISGATASGKTTFLNTLVNFIPPYKRIITVEDTREVVIPHDNRVHFVVSRTENKSGINYNDILDTIVRMTPDIIVCGEISVRNANSIYRLMTTGHSNFMSTIHADSPEMALKGFWQNLTQSIPNIDQKSVLEILQRSFGRIVQIKRVDGQRTVTAIEAPKVLQEIKDELLN